MMYIRESIEYQGYTCKKGFNIPRGKNNKTNNTEAIYSVCSFWKTVEIELSYTANKKQAGKGGKTMLLQI